MTHTGTYHQRGEVLCSLFDLDEPESLNFMSKMNVQSHRTVWEDGKFCFLQSLSLQSEQ